MCQCLFTLQEDDMPVITYRLVPAAAENATCPLDSLATTSQYRTLGIRLTKEMLCKYNRLHAKMGFFLKSLNVFL